jgi:type II secretory pathway pseudopilin PulG
MTWNGYDFEVVYGRARKQTARVARGFIAAEALVALGIVMIATTVVTQAVFAYLRDRNDFMLERTLRLAAQAQLERYRAGVPLNAAPPADLLPRNVTLATTTRPGVGPWAGMTQVIVTATCFESHPRGRSISLSGYYPEVRAK